MLLIIVMNKKRNIHTFLYVHFMQMYFSSEAQEFDLLIFFVKWNYPLILTHLWKNPSHFLLNFFILRLFLGIRVIFEKIEISMFLKCFSLFNLIIFGYLLFQSVLAGILKSFTLYITPRAFTLSDLVHEQTESPPVMLRKIKTNAELSLKPKNCDRWIVPN